MSKNKVGTSEWFIELTPEGKRAYCDGLKDANNSELCQSFYAGQQTSLSGISLQALKDEVEQREKAQEDVRLEKEGDSKQEQAEKKFYEWVLTKDGEIEYLRDRINNAINKGECLSEIGWNDFGLSSAGEFLGEHIFPELVEADKIDEAMDIAWGYGYQDELFHRDAELYKHKDHCDEYAYGGYDEPHAIFRKEEYVEKLIEDKALRDDTVEMLLNDEWASSELKDLVRKKYPKIKERERKGE